MYEPALKAGIWIKAQLRLCDLNFTPAVIARRGDDDAGYILLILDRRGNGCDLYTQARNLDGVRGWMHATNGTAVPREEADAYIQRQVSRDPDLWVLEIDDPEGRYELDGPLI